MQPNNKKDCGRCKKPTIPTLDGKHCTGCARAYDSENGAVIPCILCNGFVPIICNYCPTCKTPQDVATIPTALIQLMDRYELDEDRVNVVLIHRVGKEFQGIKMKTGHVVKVLLAIAKARQFGTRRCYVRAVDHVRRDLNVIIKDEDEADVAGLLNNWWQGYVGDVSEEKQKRREELAERVRVKLGGPVKLRKGNIHRR